MRSIRISAIVLSMLAFAGAVQAQSFRGRSGRQDEQKTPQGTFNPVHKEEKRFPLGASWIAVSMNGKTFAGTERPAIALDDQFRVRGFGGCNSFSATAFPLKEQGIAVGPLAMTKRSCDKNVMATEQAFFSAFRTSAKWDTVVGSLVIKGPNGELKFERSL